MVVYSDPNNGHYKKFIMIIIKITILGEKKLRKKSTNAKAYCF